jgi:hypothetical protein
LRFNICTKLDNGAGLEADYRLLKSLLESWGHVVEGVNHFYPYQASEADVNIFLELIAEPVIGRAKQSWFIPNPEWYSLCHDALLTRLDKVLCKTREAFNTFSRKVGANRCVHIGFESKDLYDPSVERQRKFLHVAGKSSYKNSEAVAYAFAKFFSSPWDKDDFRELVYVGENQNLMNIARDHKNVTYIKHAGEDELKRLMNECLFHIMPSKSEGWGHVIHEGLGCGAVMITTDFPPMNEFTGASVFIPSQKNEPCCLGHNAWVGAFDVRDSIEKAWKMTPAEIFAAQKKAQRYFYQQRQEFRDRLKQVVDGAL